MAPQEKAQLDYAVKRYKAAETYIRYFEAEFMIVPAEYSVLGETRENWQSLVNSKPTISEMETVEDGKYWPVPKNDNGPTGHGPDICHSDADSEL